MPHLLVMLKPLQLTNPEWVSDPCWGFVYALCRDRDGKLHFCSPDGAVWRPIRPANEEQIHRLKHGNQTAASDHALSSAEETVNHFGPT